MVFAYLRVSTGKQCTENQKEEILRFALNKGITIDRWVTEVVSGRKHERNRLLGVLLSDMKKGDLVIVTELSRLSRTLLDIMTILNTCITKQVTLYSTKDGYEFDNSINSKVLGFAFGLVAEIERNLISMRTKEALALRKAQGVQLGRPYGENTKQKVLAKDKEHIRELFLKGYSVAAVCREYGVSRETFYLVNRKHQLIIPKNTVNRTHEN